MLAALGIGISLSGCGKPGLKATLSQTTTATVQAPAVGAPQGPKAPAPTDVAGSAGAVAVVTQNTTRLGGANPATDAAAVAESVYPGLTAATRPASVVLVDDHDWRTALAAASLMTAPLNAPMLFTDGGRVPPATSAALRALAPTGASADTHLSGVQVVRVGTAAAVPGYATLVVGGSGPAQLAQALEQVGSQVRGHSPHHVIVVSADAPAAWSLPAAGLAAESGAPILFVDRNSVPKPTRETLRSLGSPSIYMIGPDSAIDAHVAHQLERYGNVTRIGGADPISNAIAVAQYESGGFGWGVIDPGHGLVFVNSARPLDAAAAAPLSASGQYGPLLLLDDRNAIPPAVSTFLSSIQPGYTADPHFSAVRGVYNHGWLIGDIGAISARSQAQLDALLAIALRGSPTAVPISR